MEDILEQLDDDQLEEMQIEVDPGQAAIRVDKFIVQKLSQISRNKIQNAIDAGLVKINKQVCKANVKIKPGDILDLVLPKSQAPEGLIAEDIPLEIIYEDDDVLIINKAQGMIVHPAPGKYTGTLLNALAFYLNIDSGAQSVKGERLGLVHRIDKETSGLLIIAKNDFALSHLAKQFYNHTIKREYNALVWGCPEEKKGTVTGHIGRNPRNRQTFMVFKDADQGKHAVTHYEVLEDLYYVSLVKCVLETGRTHQIRVHLKYIGNPLFNDEKYGGDSIHKGTVFSKYKQFVQNCFEILPHQALHAKILGFIHPVTEKYMEFEVPIPDNYNQLLIKWRNYTNTRKSIIENEES